MQVSSKHMTLASPVFKAMFTSPFAESETLRAIGQVEIELPDDDCFAFTILMNIIHARGQQTPREVSVKTLASIAILVDKYELHNSVTIFARMWVDRILERTSYIREQDEAYLLLWLSISWVFRNNPLFTGVSKKLINHIQSEFDVAVFDKLPIPQQIFGKYSGFRCTCKWSSLSGANLTLYRCHPEPQKGHSLRDL